ncbi:hypothetical protein DUNSADRAFT_13694 [Dunaliella salina]|uniref:Encoded protein n=1 Tax=Dunaliella salina TaxID=3046 RepID=A0ABQ7G8T8_DUNSA|nr:hypothetical protein DUNSADRAFT_13694 [Dunaliella salina]|eukprot:KAF5831025.1 hypothetical protein DUNSADRAFT_13694 [Dunaliella salina]
MEPGMQRRRGTAMSRSASAPAASCQMDPADAQLEDEASASNTPSLPKVTTLRPRSFGSLRPYHFSTSKCVPSVPFLPIKHMFEDAYDGSDAGLTTNTMPSTPKCSHITPPNPFVEDASPSVASSSSSTSHSGSFQPSSTRISFASSTNLSAPLSCSSSHSLPQQPQQQQQRSGPSRDPSSAGSSTAASAVLDNSFLTGLPPICCPRTSVLPPSSDGQGYSPLLSSTLKDQSWGSEHSPKMANHKLEDSGAPTCQSPTQASSAQQG